MSNPIINKRGYLNRDYMFFHLKDKSTEELDFHYHEFDKIVLILSGSVTYTIEGKSYFCKPGDILLVNHHDIHKPVFDSSTPYERIVIWINHDFIFAHSSKEADLTLCFQIAKKRSMYLMRYGKEKTDELLKVLEGLEKAFTSDEFASRLMSNSYFIQFLILINRFSLSDSSDNNSMIYRYDRKIEDIIVFIRDNLAGDLSVDSISSHFFISKSYLMHKFKDETGYSLHNYVLQKRLLYAKDLLMEDIPVIEVSERCGFNDYSTFLRAFKKMFHALPSDYEKS